MTQDTNQKPVLRKLLTVWLGCDRPECSAVLTRGEAGYEWKSASGSIQKLVSAMFPVENWRPEDGDTVLWMQREVSKTKLRHELDYPYDRELETIQSGIVF